MLHLHLRVCVRLRLRVHGVRLDVRHGLCGALNRHGGLRVGLRMIRARLWLWPMLRSRRSWVRHCRLWVGRLWVGRLWVSRLWVGRLWVGSLWVGSLRVSRHLGWATGAQGLARIERRSSLRSGRGSRRNPGLRSGRIGSAANIGVWCVRVGAHVVSPSLKIVSAHRPSWLMHG